MSDGICMNCNCNECHCDEESEGAEFELLPKSTKTFRTSCKEPNLSNQDSTLFYQTLTNKFPPVLNKRDFVRRYEAGEFGNRSPTWNTLSEFLASGYKGLIHLRNRIAGGETWYNVAVNDVDLYWTQALSTGLKPTDLYISGMCPTERTLIQGEVMQSEKAGLNLYYSRVKKPMREALKESSRTVVGSVAQKFLQYYLCPNSYEWIQVLLDRYPDHVIEFTTLDCCWGTIPNYNTLFWEVRGGY